MSPTLSTAAASGSASMAALVILQWGLAMRGIQIPADVAVALHTLLTAVLHPLVATTKTSNPTP
jgi:hypothetical protein